MSFSYPEISIVALLVGAVVQLVVGFAWYSPMLPTGKAWAANMQVPADAKPGMEMIGFPIGCILVAWAIAMVVGWSGASGAAQGALVGLTVSAAVGGHTITTIIANSSRIPPMYAIHLGYVVVSFAITGAVIGVLS